jgi:hypothetical protein
VISSDGRPLDDRMVGVAGETPLEAALGEFDEVLGCA